MQSLWGCKLQERTVSYEMLYQHFQDLDRASRFQIIGGMGEWEELAITEYMNTCFVSTREKKLRIANSRRNSHPQRRTQWFSQYQRVSPENTHTNSIQTELIVFMCLGTHMHTHTHTKKNPYICICNKN